VLEQGRRQRGRKVYSLLVHPRAAVSLHSETDFFFPMAACGMLKRDGLALIVLFLVFAELLSWQTASGPGPSLLHPTDGERLEFLADGRGGA
jgi:hypothetical protein